MDWAGYFRFQDIGGRCKTKKRVEKGMAGYMGKGWHKKRIA